MAVAVEEMWGLLEQSGLADAAEVRQLRQEFGAIRGAAQTSSHTLAAWLADRGVVTPYQNLVLAAGRPGPFDFGDYRLLSRETAGALAGEFRAVHRPTGYAVLLRFLGGDYLRDNALWEQVVRRTVAWSQAASRHLVAYHHAAALPRHRFLVLEDLRGGTLGERLQRGRLSLEQAAHVGRLAAMGLSLLHQQGLCHGRVTPHSIWLCDDGNVKWLVDPLDSHGGENGDLRIRHELSDYAAPELASLGASPATDLYGLGCVLLEALTGGPPFPGGEPDDKQRRHASEPIALPPEIPPDLARVITFLMAKNPPVRTASAAKAAEELTPWVTPQWRAFRPAPPSPAQRAYERWLRQHPPSTTPPRLPSEPLPAPPAAASRTLPPTPAAAPPEAPTSPPRPLPVEPSSSPAASSTPARPLPVEPSSSPAAVPPPAALPQPSPEAQAVFARLAEGGTAAVEAPPTLSRPADPDPEGPPVRRRRNVNSLWRLTQQALLGGGAALLLGAVAYLLTLSGRREPEPRRPLPSQFASIDPARKPPSDAGQPRAATDDQGGPGDAGASGPAYRIVERDDGESLWAPPTRGEPYSLRLSPAQVQVVAAIRPEMFESEEGERLRRALGPRFAELQQQWEQSAGTPWSEVESLVLTLHPNGQDFPRAAFAVTLRSPAAREEFWTRWPGAQVRDAEGGELATVGSWSVYAPAGEQVAAFAMGAAEDMEDVASRQGAAPPLRAVAEKLMQYSDRQRQLNILAFPHDLYTDLFRDGRTFYFGAAEKLREPLDWLLGDGLQAVLLTAHVDQQGAYVDLRLAPELGLDRYDLADKLRQRLDELPRTLQSYLAQQINPPPYWREVAFQLPVMLRFVHDQLRVQTEDAYAVINAHLPTTAAHNLAFAGEMLLVSQPGAPPVVASAPAAAAPRDINELLRHQTTIAFSQLSLEFAMNAVAADVRETFPNLPFPFAIRMMGNDLEVGSITRNQQIRDFNQQDQTISSILTAMVLKANPDPGATGPEDPKQTLVWAVGPNPDNPSENIILITTRVAATTQGYQLDPIFGE